MSETFSRSRERGLQVSPEERGHKHTGDFLEVYKCARLVSRVLSVIFEQYKLTVGHFEIWGPGLVV